MEPKTESIVKYDDRKKEMSQYFKSVQEIEMDNEVVGKVVLIREATFNEDGIRKVMNTLTQQQMKLEQTIKQIKNNLKEIPEITPELKELEKNIKIINDFNKAEQMKSQIGTSASELKTIKRDISDIKNTIGSRLKF